MDRIDAGAQWDDVAEAHDITVADFVNYVLMKHPILPSLTPARAEQFDHRPVGCPCIAAQYDRADYVKLFG